MIITDRSFRVTAEHDQAIAYWWRMKLDTNAISKKLGVHESAVANRLMHVRQNFRGERADTVGRLLGDPAKGRSALDQKQREGA